MIFFWRPAAMISRRAPTLYTILKESFRRETERIFFWFGRFLEYDIFFWPPAAIILRRRPTLHAILKESFRRQTKRIFLVEYVLFSKSHIFFVTCFENFGKQADALYNASEPRN